MNRLYFFLLDFQTPKGFQATSSPINEHLLWHRRLAHPSEFIFSKINLGLNKGIHDCEIFHYSKSVRLPFPSSLSKSTQALELVHSNVWGPFTFRLMVLTKGEVFSYFKDFT